jgi:signal transduction histidine kinase
MEHARSSLAAILRGLPGSLRGRLLAGTVLWIVLAIAVAGWALSQLFQQHLARQLGAEFNVYMNQLVAGLTVDAEGRAHLSFEPTEPRLELPYSGLYWQIDQLDAQGSSIAGVLQSRSLWDQVLNVPPATLRKNGTDPGGLVQFEGPDRVPMLALIRTVTPPEGASRYRLIFAADAKTLSGPLSRFNLMLAISLGLLALGLTAAALLQVLSGLKPLARLRQQLAAVRDGTQTRIDQRFPSEIQPLVDEFNQVLNNNNQIVNRARTQAGNLAHALKTPLSVLANAARQDTTAFGHLVSEQVDLAQRQVEHHLARARAAAAVRTPGISTAVQPVLAGLTRTLSKLYTDKGVSIHLYTLSSHLAFKGEQHDLQEMLGNLLDNACKWARQHVWVQASLQTVPENNAGPSGAISASAPENAPNTVVHGTQLVIRVEDDGPGLPATQRDNIFERGVRLDERTPGSGLGLAIVRDLALAYGGSVRAFSSERGGLGVELNLPGLESVNKARP